MTDPSSPLPEATPPTEPPPRRRRWVRRLLIGFLVVANVAIFGGLAAVWWAARQVAESVAVIAADDLELSETPHRTDEPRTFLLIGSDSRADLPPDLGPFGDFGGQRADVIMLVQVHPGEGRLQILSIPRDLKVSMGGVPGKINATFAEGAPGIVAAVTAATGLPIHHYVEVDFAGFAGVVDAMGGIEMTFPYPVRDEKAGLWIDAGRHTLDGRSALALARSRAYQELRPEGWVAVDANDIGRTKRQQDLLMAMLSQIDRPSSIGEAADLVEAFGAFALTDDSLGENDIIQLAWEMRSLGADDLEAETLPVVDLEENGVWYVTELEPEAAQVIGAFAAGEAMAPARAGPVPVAVQNGNGRIGAAALAGETLDAAGFDVISVGDSGRADYPTTLVISRPDDLPLADAVAEALGFGEAMVGRVPPEADVVVIVGLDVPAG